MTDGNKESSLINIGAGKLSGKIYDDILSPPSKKVGQALSTIFDLGNTALWPVKWFNERTRIYFSNNIKRYEENIHIIPNDKIANVPSEISLPILQRLAYVTNKNISEAFINLLTNASNLDNAHMAHPAFIHIIDRLSSDEALIIQSLKDRVIKEDPLLDEPIVIPFLQISAVRRKDQSTAFTTRSRLTTIHRDIKLTFPKNSSLYFQNLMSLGLIEEWKEKNSKCSEDYERIKRIYKKNKLSDLQPGAKAEDYDFPVWVYGTFVVSPFGTLFIKACFQL